MSEAYRTAPDREATERFVASSRIVRCDDCVRDGGVACSRISCAGQPPPWWRPLVYAWRRWKRGQR